MKFSLSWIRDFVDVAPGGAGRARELLDQAGFPVESVETLGEDSVFDVEITPNRPDAMSHRGLAREIAAMSGRDLSQVPAAHEPPSEGEPAETLTSVVIQVPRLCRRFGARLVRGVRVAAASEKVRARLAAIGGKPINAPVDATNYVLWDIGQPLHVFDFDKLAGGLLIVRKARSGETLVTLDGATRGLETSDIVIADAERAVSLAGVMGGLDTAVTAGTRNVLLEAAWWDPVSIRRTSRRLGLHTDASHRFERGADPEAIPEALNLAARLILEASGGRLAPGILDARGSPFKQRQTALRLSRLRLLAGDDRLTLEFAEDALRRLGFLSRRRGRRIAVTIPIGRHDIRREDDLVEEVLRVYGYDRLPLRLPPAALPGGHLEPRRVIEDRLADGAVEAGLFETVGYPFVNSGEQEAGLAPWLDAAGMGEALSVANPLDETRRNLRRSLLPGVLDALSHNARHGRSDAALFEIGRVFGCAGGAAERPETLESRRFAFALSGEWRSHWSAPVETRKADFYDAKGVVERLLEPWILPQDLRWRDVPLPVFTPGAAARVETGPGALLGILGRIAPSEGEKRSLPHAVFAGEILIEAIPLDVRQASFQPYSVFPAVTADLSFSHARETTWEEIAEFIRGQRINDVESVRVLDRYEAPEGGTDRVKTTVRVSFRSADRTLSQEEVNRKVEALVHQMQSGLGATFA